MAAVQPGRVRSHDRRSGDLRRRTRRPSPSVLYQVGVDFRLYVGPLKATTLSPADGGMRRLCRRCVDGCER